jgi:peptide/nickel transport system permease protein
VAHPPRGPPSRDFFFVALVLAVAIFAPWLTLHSPEDMDMEARLAGPSASHWLGTDNFGRDLWARVAFGSRISLTIALSSVGAGLVLGTVVGLVSGYFGGLLDQGLMRVVDLFLAFPPFILALALVAILGPGVSSVVIASPPSSGWSTRGSCAPSRSRVPARDYGHGREVTQATHARLLFRQILPRASGPSPSLPLSGLEPPLVPSPASVFSFGSSLPLHLGLDSPTGCAT